MTSRLYRLALHVLPGEVRARHGAAMATVFDELVCDSRRRGGRRAVAAAVIMELAALARFAVSAWRGRPAPRRLDERLLAASPTVEGSAPMFASLVQDVRYAARWLRRSPGWSPTTVAGC